MHRLLTKGQVDARRLDEIPEEFRAYAVKRFVHDNSEMNLSYMEDERCASLVNSERIISLLDQWDSTNARLSRPRTATDVRRVTEIDLSQHENEIVNDVQHR